MTRAEFLDQMMSGAAAAMGEGPCEPFGLWPHPPMPALRHLQPITVKTEGE